MDQRLLIVDDQSVRARALVEMLGDRARGSRTVPSASRALQHVALGNFTLVLTALHLSEVDGLGGIDLLREIDNLDRDLPVILILDGDAREALAGAIRARAFDVIWRPIDPAQLLDAIERGLAARSAAVAARELALSQRQRLERRSALLSVVFEEGSDGVLTWDTSGRLVDLSPSILTLTGASQAEIFARGSRVIFEPEPFGGSLEDRIPSLARQVGQHRHEVVVRTSDGPAPARLTLTVCELPPSEEGSPPVRWVIGVLQPPRHEGLRERLRRADRLAGAVMVSGSAAHEIKNDLTPLLTCMALLDEADVVDEDLAEIVREAKRCVHRIESGVEQILAPLRTKRPRRSRVDVGSVIRQSVTFIRRRGHERKPKVVLEIADDLPPVLARPDDLHQIVNNLVTNAFEAIAESRPTNGDSSEIRVELACDPTTNALVLCVHDNGPGIPPADQARVFEPFFTTKGLGTGLGLTVTRDLVRGLGGDLEIESVPAVTGTRVCVHLPAAS